MKNIIDSGEIGKVVSMQLNEHVWYGHFVNAYVRGKWRSEEACGSGLLLAKCCHDTDLICWLNNTSTPKKVSSFGSKSFYTQENAPKGATKYCYQCPHKDTCVFDAYKFQIEKDFIPFYTWAGLNKPIDEITLEEKVEYLKHDVYGQCVYQTDGMDIVDRQCVSVEFENGAIATLNMITGASVGRKIHVVGEWGEIIGAAESDKIHVTIFDKQNVEFCVKTINLNIQETQKSMGNGTKETAGHGGGDYYLMHEAVRYFSDESNSVSITKIEDSVNSHLVVYAAEISRKENKIVYIDEL